MINSEIRPYKYCFKGGGPKMITPAPLPPKPVRYSAEAEAAKRDILERNRGARSRAASRVSSPALSSIMPNFNTPVLFDKLGGMG